MGNCKRIALSPVLMGLLCVGLLGSLLAGCGSDSTVNPTLFPSDKSSDSMVPTPDRETSSKGEVGDETQLPTDNEMIGPASRTAEFDVDPELGGTFAAGRVAVAIPSDALSEPITLKIYDNSSGSMSIIGELLPHGLAFLKPVTLSFDLRGTVAEGWDDACVFWFDEKNSQWVNIGGNHDLDSHILSVKLEHFSSYGVGRAGWFSKPPPPVVQDPPGGDPEAGSH